jgi:hypothetical protein
VKGTWREGSLAGDPKRYVEKALEMGISFHRGPVLGNLEEGSSTGDFGIRKDRRRSAQVTDITPQCHGGPFTGNSESWLKGGSGNRAPLFMGAF